MTLKMRKENEKLQQQKKILISKFYMNFFN